MSPTNAADPSVASTTSSREHMPPPPPRLPQNSTMHHVNSRGADFGNTSSCGNHQSLDEPSFDSLSALSLASTDTDSILAHWRKQRHNNSSTIALNLQGKKGKESAPSAFRRLNVNTEEDLFNYSDSFSMAQSHIGSQKHDLRPNSRGIGNGSYRKIEDDSHSANTSPMLNGHARRSALNGHNGGGNNHQADGDNISLLQSYNSTDEHISVQDFNSVATQHESPYKNVVRPQNPQHTHFETDLSIISHSSESVSSAFLAGLRAVSDGLPLTHKPLVTPRVMDSNGVRRSVGGFHSPPQNNSNQSTEERDEVIRRLELEVEQWKKAHANLNSMKQQQSDLVKEIEQLKQNVNEYTSQYNSICDNIETREEELTHLKADVQFAQSEKEELKSEYEQIREQISQSTRQLEEEHSALDSVEIQKREAVRALGKAKADLERVTKETETIIANCKSRESEVTELVKRSHEMSKQLRADENRLQTDQRKLDTDRATLENDKAELSQQQIDFSQKCQAFEKQRQMQSQSLEEEKRQINLVQSELLRVQTAQSESASKLKQDEAALEEYSHSLKQQGDALMNRETACSELEALVESRMENLSAREKSCAKREEDVAEKFHGVASREGICKKRELELDEALKKMTQLEIELSQKVEDLAARDAALVEREKKCEFQEQETEKTANEVKSREQLCNDMEEELQNAANELTLREQNVTGREQAVEARETECTELESDLVDAGDVLTQREELCAQKLDDANSRIEKFIEREKIVCKREEEAEERSKQLSDQERLLVEKCNTVDLLSKSVAGKEAFCSKKEKQLTEREERIQHEHDDLKSRTKALELEKQTVYQNRYELEEQRQSLKELTEAQNNKMHQTNAREEALIAAKLEMDEFILKIEAEQARLAEKEASLNSSTKQLNDTIAEVEKEKNVLLSKTSDLSAKEEVLAKGIESSKHKEENLRRKEATLISLEQSLVTRERDLEKRDKDVHSQMSEISERERLLEQSHVLSSKILGEEQRLIELQTKCEEASNKLYLLQDEASNLRPVLSEAVARFEKESKEVEDITRRKQMLAQEVSILNEKVKNANADEERARNAVSVYGKQQEDLMNRMRHQRELFEKALKQRSNELIALHQSSRRQLETEAKSAMNQFCQTQATAFEKASRELAYRQEQIELMVSNLSKFRVHLASSAEEKHVLSKELDDSMHSLGKCRTLLEKTQNDLMYSQRQCACLQSRIEEQHALNLELEEERTVLCDRITELEKKISNLETAKLECQQELDEFRSSKNSQLEQKAQKLKEFMQSITTQNERLSLKQKSLEDKESALILHEKRAREESIKNDDLYTLVQQQNATLKSLEQELELRQSKYMSKEQELDQTEERLVNMEAALNQKQEEINAGKQKMKELALQLQQRNEEINKQKQHLQEKIRSCDEYEASLTTWEQRLEEVANMIQQRQEEDGPAS